MSSSASAIPIVCLDAFSSRSPPCVAFWTSVYTPALALVREWWTVCHCLDESPSELTCVCGKNMKRPAFSEPGGWGESFQTSGSGLCIKPSKRSIILMQTSQSGSYLTTHFSRFFISIILALSASYVPHNFDVSPCPHLLSTAIAERVLS